MSACPISARAASFDPFEDEYQQDPAACLAWSRADEPVFYSPKLGYWVVTRYDDVKAIFRDNISFSPAIALEKITPTGSEANAVLASYGFALNRTLVNEDEPAHMPRRRLLMEPFTPAQIKEHEPLARQLAREFVDKFINDGKADLVDQILWEVPLTVALHFLGVPEEDMDQLRQYSIAHTVNTWGRPKPEEQVAVAHAVGNFWQLAGRILEKMRADPDGPGWMRFGIRQQREHPDIVTDSYLHSMMMAGIVAAHETTANACANALKVLLEHPTAWSEICEDRSLIPGAVEECLRHNGSVAAWRRVCTRDVEIAGVSIQAGQKLLIVSSSANHDERHFVNADELDIRRENSTDQLTFGYGSHQCMGKNLARMELHILLDELARRLPHMRLAKQSLSYLPNTSFRGPEHLWVEWDVQKNPERIQAAVLQQHELHPDPGGVARPVRVAAVRTIVSDEMSVVIELGLESANGSQMPAWTAGAHIQLECGDSTLRRDYSLCGDATNRQRYTVALRVDKQADKTSSGSAWLAEHAIVGANLLMRGPRQHFSLQPQASSFWFVAGGIGITPIMAMAAKTSAMGKEYQIWYCGSRRETMPYLRELQAVHGDRLHLCISSEGTRLSLTQQFSQPPANVAVHACGPSAMLDELSILAEQWQTASLRVEHFSNKKLDSLKTNLAFSVHLRDSDVSITVLPEQTLLEALNAANIDVPSDCKEGLCGTCEVRVLSGQIEHRDVVLTPKEQALNTRMMACCSRALTPCHTPLVLEL